MHSVYCYSAHINPTRRQDDESSVHRLSPPIVLVGTHRSSFSNLTNKVAVGFYELYFYLLVDSIHS